MKLHVLQDMEMQQNAEKKLLTAPKAVHFHDSRAPAQTRQESNHPT
jgi:hypothetical protein